MGRDDIEIGDGEYFFHVDKWDAGRLHFSCGEEEGESGEYVMNRADVTRLHKWLGFMLEGIDG